MSVKIIRVRAWNSTVGALAPNERLGAYAFQYSRDWVRGGIELAPETMPIAKGANHVWLFPNLPDCFQKMPGLVSDALPDAFGNALIEAFLAGRGVRPESITELDRLAYMGRRGMGALEFEPADGPEEEHNATPIAIKSLVEQARSVIAGTLDQSEASKSLQELIRVGTSAGGQRAKAVIAWNAATNEIRSGQFDAPAGFDHWLLKFDGIGRDLALGSSAEYGRIEYAYYLMATAAGINMSPCHLLEEGGRAHFMTKRFDRDGAKRHHVQTLCGMSHLSYQLRNTHSYNQYFMVIKDTLKLGDTALQEAFRRMAFNVCARNQDDHTKNFGFLLPKDGAWQLSPAYDMTYAYNPDSIWTRQHLMSVNGKFDDITREDLLVVAERFLVPDAPKLLSEVNDAVQSWKQFAREANLSNERIDGIAKNLIRISPARRKAKARSAGRPAVAIAPAVPAPNELDVEDQQQRHHHDGDRGRSRTTSP